MEKEKCKCGKMATWVYMPASEYHINPYYCDDCVPRGCTCNVYNINEEWCDLPEDYEIEGVDWMWIDEEKTAYEYVDEKGRSFPCCEFMEDEEGFEIEGEENE